MKKIAFGFIITLFITSCESGDKKTAVTTNSQDSSSQAPVFNSIDNAGDSAKAISDAAQGHIAKVDTSNYTTIEWIDKINQTLPKIKEGEVISITYRFRNTGSKPLVIQDVNPGCGCTVAEKPQEPIMPGQKGLIKAKFDSHGQVGSRTKNLTVVANTNGDKLLTFSVEVEK